MNAITLLKEDHKRIKRMLAEGEETTERAEKTRTELFERLKETMLAHESMEEQVLYPALKEHPKAKDLTLEAYEEHHVVDLVFEELEKTPVNRRAMGRQVHGRQGEHRAPHRAKKKTRCSRPAARSSRPRSSSRWVPGWPRFRWPQAGSVRGRPGGDALALG